MKKRKAIGTISGLWMFGFFYFFKNIQRLLIKKEKKATGRLISIDQTGRSIKSTSSFPKYEVVLKFSIVSNNSHQNEVIAKDLLSETEIMNIAIGNTYTLAISKNNATAAVEW